MYQNFRRSILWVINLESISFFVFYFFLFYTFIRYLFTYNSIVLISLGYYKETYLVLGQSDDDEVRWRWY